MHYCDTSSEMAAGDYQPCREVTSLVVDGQGIIFHFDRKKGSIILNGVNIAVNQGSIYSLLGPSGCGKTTLLKCIVGQLKPQGGSLKTYGRTPGSKGFFIPGPGVGYMPQDLALYMEMSTEEILTYYGTLYGVAMKNINARIAFLLDLLELPNKKRLIQNLSGGQQRRVSFAIALIHKPPLLVLDEPTVGVDPILRKAIWDHLVNLAMNERSTIIVTTHYTEEARQAHTVGFMRHGQLLVERNPEDLIQQCGACTLEDVFLKLCQNKDCEDDTPTSNPETLTTVTSSKRFGRNGIILDQFVTCESRADPVKFGSDSDETFGEINNDKDNETASLQLSCLPKEYDGISFNTTKSGIRLFYLTRKNFLRLKRNIPLMIFTVCISAIQAVIFFLCLSSDPHDLQVAVVNDETGGLNKFGEKLLLSISDQTITLKSFDNFTLAYESFKRGESWGVLHIHSDFSTCLVDRILEGVHVTNDTLRCSTVKLVLDMSNYIISGTIGKSLLASYQTFSKELLETLGQNPAISQLPLQIEEFSHSSGPASFSEFTAPALIASVAFVMSISLTCLSLIAEKTQGLLGRAIVAGATTTEILLSFFFALLVLLLLQVALMLLVTFLMFSTPCNGSVFWFVIATTLCGLCGMAYGFLISAMTDSVHAASTIVFGTFFPVVLLSGMFWPVEAMPRYLRYFSNSLPLTRIIESNRSIMTRGWKITENYVWDGYLICVFWTIVYMALSIILLKIRK